MQAAVGYLQSGSSTPDDLEKLLLLNPKPAAVSVQADLTAQSEPTPQKSKAYSQRMIRRELEYLVKTEGMDPKVASTLAIEREIGFRRDKSPVPEEELRNYRLRHLDVEIEYLVSEEGISQQDAEKAAYQCAGLTAPREKQVLSAEEIFESSVQCARFWNNELWFDDSEAISILKVLACTCVRMRVLDNVLCDRSGAV